MSPGSTLPARMSRRPARRAAWMARSAPFAGAEPAEEQEVALGIVRVALAESGSIAATSIPWRIGGSAPRVGNVAALAAETA